MSEGRVPAGTVEDLKRAGRKVVKVGRASVLVLWHDDRVHALDNRCPHMGFPLHRGDVHDGILDCHWHHARFDISCGATLDPWADDAESYRVVIEDGGVFVDPERPPRDPRRHGLARLRRGMEDSVRLVIARAVLEMTDGGVPAGEIAAAAALHGAREREDGWQPGLSILAAMANVLPTLAASDRPKALVHAAARVAADCAGRPPRRPLPGLEGSGRDRKGLRDWFRETVEVRDPDGAERVLATLVDREGPVAALDAVLAAATDHRYAGIGHTLDYAVKCAELYDHLGGDDAGETGRLLFTSLVPQLTAMQRMEESSSWRRPVDVAALVEEAWRGVPAEPFRGEVLGESEAPGPVMDDEDALVERILDDDPAETLSDLVGRVERGQSPVALAQAVVAAATRRVLHFGSANEVPDWDTVHHTLTYANAVAEAMRRAPSPELFRAVLDGAMSVYLDRFLNVPPAALPQEGEPGKAEGGAPTDLLVELLWLYDGRSAVDEAAAMAWEYLSRGGEPARLLETLGAAVLREDAGFHEFQQLDIAWRALQRRGASRAGRYALVACARWIASAYPTRRAAEQTFHIARRLQRGEAIHEE